MFYCKQSTVSKLRRFCFGFSEPVLNESESTYVSTSNQESLMLKRMKKNEREKVNSVIANGPINAPLVRIGLL